MWNIWARFGSHHAKRRWAGGRLCEKVHTHSIIDNFSLQSFLCVWYSVDKFHFFIGIVWFKCHVREKLFFPLYHEYAPCLFWGFIWNWHEEPHPTEWSCTSTGWGCRNNGLKIDMSLYLWPIKWPYRFTNHQTCTWDHVCLWLTQPKSLFSKFITKQSI